jgi:uncharacterized cupredoxin-like copper-binding protein
MSGEGTMNRSVHSALRLAAAFAIGGAFAVPALADGTIVQVALWDKGTSAPMAMDQGLGMANASQADSNMGIKLSTEKVKAGEVTFEVTNSSQETIHEMLVIPAPANGKVPYDENEGKFDEDKAGSLGEVEETDPGKSGTLTLNLKPGRYILSCNIPNHFANGMWTAFTVE